MAKFRCCKLLLFPIHRLNGQLLNSCRNMLMISCVDLIQFHAGPSPTTCQKAYLEALRQYRPGRFIPRCTRDGNFEPVQLSGPDAYCVDNGGKEIPGTRVTRPFRPNCIVGMFSPWNPAYDCTAFMTILIITRYVSTIYELRIWCLKGTLSRRFGYVQVNSQKSLLYTFTLTQNTPAGLARTSNEI